MTPHAMAPYGNGTISPSKHITMTAYTIVPHLQSHYHCHAMTPVIMTPSHHDTMSHDSRSPWQHNTMLLWQHVTMTACHHVTMTPCYHVTVHLNTDTPWNLDTTPAWYCVTITPITLSLPHQVTMSQWNHTLWLLSRSWCGLDTFLDLCTPTHIWKLPFSKCVLNRPILSYWILSHW